MRRIALCCAVVAMSLSAHAQGLVSDPITIEGVKSVDRVLFSNSALINENNTRSSDLIQFPLGRFGAVEIDIFPHSIVSQDYISSSNLSMNVPMTFQGFSSDGGQVRLTIADQFTYGYIEFENETFWIEPAWYYLESGEKSQEIVVYRQSDMIPNTTKTCGVTETRERKKELNKSASSQRNNRLGQCYIAEIAIASDYAMYVKYNSSVADVELHNIGVINNVNGNYSGPFDDDIEFLIVDQFVSACSSCDPWSSSTNPYTLLNSFRAWAEGGGFAVDFDLGEMWTNRDFDGTTVGLAWLGQVCSSYNYHVLQDFNSNANLLRVMTAHEIGHNFDADHDANSSPHVMAPMVQNTSTWSTGSINNISSYISTLVAGGSCLSDCGNVDPPVAQFSANSTDLCGTNTISFTDASTNNPTQWSWTFENGNPATSTAQNPQVVYTGVGTFSVSLTASNTAGVNTLTIDNYIHVDEYPDAFFSFEVDGFAILFTEESNYASSFLWNFGDGTMSTIPNPMHTYANVGTYAVSLTTTTSCGTNDYSTLINVTECAENLTLMGVVPTSSHVVSGEINMGGAVQDGNSLYLHAPSSVTLTAGFNLSDGAEMTITNNGCIE